MDDYVRHVKSLRSLLPLKVRHVVVDGYYTSRKFVDGMSALELEVVGKLRHDAALVYPYDGPQKARGRRRVYGERVRWSHLDQRHWQDEGEVEKGVRLHSAVLHHKSLGRRVRVALLQQEQQEQQEPQVRSQDKSQGVRQVLLFSTDLTLSWRDVVRF